jgi:hypothetical protein
MVTATIARDRWGRRMSTATDLRDLAAWADYASRWLEMAARCANDEADPARRTVTFEAATLDHLLTGFRRIPVLIEDLADQLDRRPALKVISGGRP